jgi:D-alanine-D-alanine ligase
MTGVLDASLFGRVAVLHGGWSAERAISLRSGAAVLDGLRRRGVDAHPVLVGDTAEAGATVLRDLVEGGFDRAFIALHGRGGEDGQIQAGLDLVGIPYTGSRVLASALAMDKIRTKLVWLGGGLPTPRFRVVDSLAGLRTAAAELGFPLGVKPPRDGSSLGMSRVGDEQQLPAAWELACRFDAEVLVEQWITGAEYTVSILDGEVLPALRLETPRTFYDYEAKYHAGTTRYLHPCGLDADALSELGSLALKAFHLVGARCWGRVDVIRDQQGRFMLLEVNTVPGMTETSLVPKSAAAVGIDFSELVWRILRSSLETG